MALTTLKASTPRKYIDKKTGEEKTKWVTLGVAFLNDEKKYPTIQLDALPIADAEGKATIHLFDFEDDQNL